jgi:[acyl-carrier-protein] S-malonyltransferase
MDPAAEKLEKALASVEIHPPAFPVVANVTAEPVQDPEDIRSLLARQVISPVRWEESVRTMKSMGVTTFIEPGPGKVLGALLKKNDRDLRAVSAATREDVESFPPNLD